MKKRSTSLAVLKQRMVLAIITNCSAGGSRKLNMVSLAKHVGVFGSGVLEGSLCAYVRENIDQRHARRLLTWMITKATYADEPAKPPVCIPKVRVDGEVLA